MVQWGFELEQIPCTPVLSKKTTRLGRIMYFGEDRKNRGPVAP